MTSVATATTSTLAADAAREVTERGGNAVDAAIAASLVSMNTEPGVCALAGGAYVTVWPAGGDPVTIDGYVEMPGRGLDPSELGRGVARVEMAYGGGVTTLVGCGSVATPGSLAALEAARARFGRLPLAASLAPAIRAARAGFPLPAACHRYLEYAGDSIFGRNEISRLALHPDGETLLGVGDLVQMPGLADTLQAIADEGSDIFYRGDIAERIVAHVRAGGGALTLEDMRTYRAIERSAVTVAVGDWRVALNPPPSIGGAVLGALLIGLNDGQALLPLLRAALQHRRAHLDLAEDLPAAGRELLDRARGGTLLARAAQSGSTVHTSAVDDDGLACAITASAGYGSGEIPDGTGLWLNNCLGEIELNRRGLIAGPPGTRLPSNMAPTAARRDGRVLAIGSPGAGRITSALAQSLGHFLLRGLSLEAAIAQPRLHVETGLERDPVDGRFPETVCFEPGARPSADTAGMAERAFDELSMYFGGVGAAACEGAGTDRARFEVAADPRRTGATCIAKRRGD